MTVSIIIPVYNEAGTIIEILRQASTAPLPPGFSREIIVVNDASTDTTLAKLTRSRVKFKLITHLANVGKGAAVKSGLEVSTGDLILIQDADLEYQPRYYYQLLTPFTTATVQVVYGSRLADYPLVIFGSRKTPLPLHLIANRFLTLLTNLVYGHSVTDMETGYKILNRHLLVSLNLRSNRFDIEAEITAKLLKRKIQIVEVPIQIIPRTYAQGKKISWLDGLAAIWTLFKYRVVD